MELSLENIIALINGVGFPIAMCVAMFYLNNFTLKAQQRALIDLQVMITNNTNATNNLAESLRRVQ